MEMWVVCEGNGSGHRVEQRYLGRMHAEVDLMCEFSSMSQICTCVCVYVCMFVCVYVCKRVCMCARMYVEYAYMYVKYFKCHMTRNSALSGGCKSASI
jgi:hypothetical protein